MQQVAASRATGWPNGAIRRKWRATPTPAHKRTLSVHLPTARSRDWSLRTDLEHGHGAAICVSATYVAAPLLGRLSV